MGKNILTDREKAEIRHRHRAGMKPCEIAREMHLKRYMVANHLAQVGLTSRADYLWSEEELQYLVDARKDGVYKGQVLDIAEHLGRPCSGVRRKIMQLIREGRTQSYARCKVYLPKTRIRT